jgi:hypothetical protein
MPLSELEDFFLFDLEGDVLGSFLFSSGTLDIRGIQPEGSFKIKFGVEQTHVNARFESWVYTPHTISGQEQYSGIILEAAEENARHSIASQVRLVTFCQKYIRFVEQKDTAPLVSQAKVVV